MTFQARIQAGAHPAHAPPPKKREREREREKEREIEGRRERRIGEGKQGGNETFNKRKNVCRSICNIFLTFSDRLLNAT